MALGTMGPARDLGPAIVDWGATTISEIFEEVRLTLNSAEAGQVFEAITGGTPVDTIMSGFSECSVAVPATRIALATFATLLAGAGSGSGGGTGPNVAIRPDQLTGISAYDSGLPLFIKPIVAGIAATPSQGWMRLEHTYPEVAFDVVFNLREQRVYGLVFKAHPDETTKMLWSAGKVVGTTSYA